MAIGVYQVLVVDPRSGAESTVTVRARSAESARQAAADLGAIVGPATLVEAVIEDDAAKNPASDPRIDTLPTEPQEQLLKPPSVRDFGNSTSGGNISGSVMAASGVGILVCLVLVFIAVASYLPMSALDTVRKSMKTDPSKSFEIYASAYMRVLPPLADAHFALMEVDAATWKSEREARDGHSSSANDVVVRRHLAESSIQPADSEYSINVERTDSLTAPYIATLEYRTNHGPVSVLFVSLDKEWKHSKTVYKRTRQEADPSPFRAADKLAVAMLAKAPPSFGPSTK